MRGLPEPRGLRCVAWGLALTSGCVVLCGGGDRRAEHGSAGRSRPGAACNPDSESAAPRAETALRVQGDPPDGLCLEGARREARTLTWRPGDGPAEARVSTLRLPGRCRRSRDRRRRLSLSGTSQDRPHRHERLQRVVSGEGDGHTAQSPVVTQCRAGSPVAARSSGHRAPIRSGRQHGPTIWPGRRG